MFHVSLTLSLSFSASFFGYTEVGACATCTEVVLKESRPPEGQPEDSGVLVSIYIYIYMFSYLHISMILEAGAFVSAGIYPGVL